VILNEQLAMELLDLLDGTSSARSQLEEYDGAMPHHTPWDSEMSQRQDGGLLGAKVEEASNPFWRNSPQLYKEQNSWGQLSEMEGNDADFMPLKLPQSKIPEFATNMDKNNEDFGNVMEISRQFMRDSRRYAP